MLAELVSPKVSKSSASDLKGNFTRLLLTRPVFCQRSPCFYILYVHNALMESTVAIVAMYQPEAPHLDGQPGAPVTALPVSIIRIMHVAFAAQIESGWATSAGVSGACALDGGNCSICYTPNFERLSEFSIFDALGGGVLS